MSVCSSFCTSFFYSSFCDLSAQLYRNDYIYLYGIKPGYLTASWTFSTNPSYVPAGMIYSKNSPFLYYFTQDSSNLYLIIINNGLGSLVASETLSGGIPNSNSYPEKLLDIDAKTGESLIWIGNNPITPSFPVIILIKLNNVTGSFININWLTHPTTLGQYSVRAVNIESEKMYKALI